MKRKREILNNHFNFIRICRQNIFEHRIKTSTKRTLKVGKFNNGYRSIFLAEDIGSLIEQARKRAYQYVNVYLIDLYWKVGEYVSLKIEADGWGKSIVKELSAYIQQRQPGTRARDAA